MELDELSEVLESLKNEEELSLFFHLTSRDNGNSINENGLYMENEILSSSTIELDNSFFEDPEHYVDYELGNPQTREKEIMVFIECYQGEENSLIKESDDQYLIYPENIIGYLDLDSKFFNINNNCELEIGYGKNI